MLKIKDSVDLKELEKFGFKMSVYFDYDYIKDVDIENTNQYIFIRIFKKNKNIIFQKIFHNGVEKYLKNQYNNKKWIQDLIKADMVEKEEE